MSSINPSLIGSRRELLRAGGAIAAGALLGNVFSPRSFAESAPAAGMAEAPQSTAPANARSSSALAQARAEMAKTPLQTLKLRENIYMLYGPGGNMVLLTGPDGKVLVDTGVAPVAAKLKQTLAGLSNAPLKLVIDSHWHFDHTDNNAALRAAGAMIVAHENTRKRMSTPHDLAPLGLHFPPSPEEALPQQTFRDDLQLHFNGEEIALTHVPPAHTDTDIFIHYRKGNVLHVADIWFNGFYPFIDGGTGGRITGMISAADKAISIADKDTKIVPGHGPLGDKAALIKYRDTLSTCRDRIQRQKSTGKSLKEVTAAKPTADLDGAWGGGMINPDTFVALVYNTL